MRTRAMLPFLAAAALLPDFAAAQPLPCPADAPIQSVLLTVSEAERHDVALTVRLQRPYAAESSARPNPGELAWSLDLRRPAPLAAIRLAPLRAGSRAVATETPWSELRGGRCVGHFGFRFEKVWRVEVTSDPEHLPVQVVAIGGTPAEQRTSFTTDPIPITGPLHLRIGGLGTYTLPLTLRPAQFGESGEIRHDTREIKRLLCGADPRSNPNACTFRYRRVATREILIRLVQP